jgi:lysophospholipase L1-like esterase
VLSVALYRVIEHPIRRGQLLPALWFAGAALGMVIVIVGGSLMLTEKSTLAVDLASGAPVRSQLKALRDDQSTGESRILIVGDSLAWTAGIGIRDWGMQQHVDVQGFVAIGCGIGGTGELRYLNIVRPTFPDCGAWHDSLKAAVAAYHPDKVLIIMGLADLSPRKFGNTYLSIGNPTYDRRLAAHVVDVAKDLSSSGAQIDWTTFPHVDAHYSPGGGTGLPPFPENEPARTDRLNQIVESAVSRLPYVKMIDLARYCQTRPGGEFDPKFRPDGVHFSLTGTKEVAAWLAPQLAIA